MLCCAFWSEGSSLAIAFHFEPAKCQRGRHFERREKVLGQFFTPPAIAEWMVRFVISFLDHRKVALDPACSDGVFLKPMLGANFKRVGGIDVNEKVLGECAKRCVDHERSQLQCADAPRLLPELERQFDLVATDSPFSAKCGRVIEPTLLSRFELDFGRNSEATEVLFLELCIRALRENGILAIVLPK